MALSRDQSIAKYGTEAYTGWGEAEASADASANPGKVGSTGGGGGGDGGFISPEDYANKLLEAQKKQIEEETKFLEQYTKDNPFIFDEELAKKSALAEYQPYYTELLQDYTKDVDLRRQSIQDEAKLLTTLHKMDTSSRTREYQQAVGRAEEGWAGSGMFFSGISKRDVGERTAEYTTGQKRSEEVYGEQQRAGGRQLTALDTALSQKTRDIGREQQEQVESGVLTRKGEAQKGYYAPLETAYYRKFPTASGAALKGYALPEYYRV